MEVNRLHWYCPKCGSIVNFGEEVEDLFDGEGDAWFNPKHGVYFTTINCNNENCDAEWILNISSMQENNCE